MLSLIAYLMRLNYTLDKLLTRKAKEARKRLR